MFEGHEAFSNDERWVFTLSQPAKTRPHLKSVYDRYNYTNASAYGAAYAYAQGGQGLGAVGDVVECGHGVYYQKVSFWRNFNGR